MLAQSLNQRQQQFLSQTQQQSLKLLMQSIPDLTESLTTLSLDNPFVHLRPFRPQANGYDIDWLAAQTTKPSLEVHLLEQIIGLEQEPILRNLIRHLDDNGYLKLDIPAFSAQFNLPNNTVKGAIETLQELDPAGIGGRTLQEVLLIQAKRANDCPKGTIKLLTQYAQSLANGDLAKIIRKSGYTRDEIENCLKFLQHLTPNPAAGFSSEDETRYAIPEIEIDADTLTTHTIKSNTPRISFNQNYFSHLAKEPDEALKKYLSNRNRDYLAVQSMLHRRQSTVLRVGNLVAEIQQDFLKNRGPLKPLLIQTAADQLQLDPSTISRAIQQKYLLFNHQVYALSFFFSRAVTAEKSQNELTYLIKHLISSEDKSSPLTDTQLATVVADNGFDIARRTVAKYRKQLGIPTAIKRQQLDIRI